MLFALYFTLDFHFLFSDAYEEIANVTSHINECVRQHENFIKMFAIQNSLVGANTPQILLPGKESLVLPLLLCFFLLVAHYQNVALFSLIHRYFCHYYQLLILISGRLFLREGPISQVHITFLQCIT